MGDMFWPGDTRAGDHLTEASLLRAMVAVEQAWLDGLVDAGLAPGVELVVPAGPLDSESSGTVVPSLVSDLRGTTGNDWVHRGLTSQDVLDTALVLELARARVALLGLLDRQVALLSGLAREHRETPMVGRTLTQHAVPITFGLKVSHWLIAVLDARDELAGLVLPVQVGGAAGTMAAAIELGLDAGKVRTALAERLGLADAPAWHTLRTVVTRAGDALVRATDAWGHIADDVLVGSRPEVGELSEGAGGGSSTMPQKSNPVLSVLVRRAALAAPSLSATLHTAAASQVDERADGAWHVEADTLRLLVRRTLVAASQTADLLDGLVVHADRMRATLETAWEDVTAERRASRAIARLMQSDQAREPLSGAIARLMHPEPADAYLGEATAIVDQVLARAQTSEEAE